MNRARQPSTNTEAFISVTPFASVDSAPCVTLFHALTRCTLLFPVRGVHPLQGS
jgi:hypothetical protein